MNISLARGELLDALSAVSKGISSRSTLPILSGVLFSASGETLTLQSTDLEISVKHTVGARVDKEGQVVVPGKLLGDIVRSLPEAAVNLEITAPDRIHLKCLQSRFDLKTLNPEDFPRFPEVSPDKSITVPSGTFTSVVRQVAKAVSRDDARPILTGVLTVVEDGVLRMVATDSYRLAVREVALGADLTETFEVVVPGRALEEVSRLLGQAEEVKIGVTENQVVFEFGSTVFISRRIEGQFPNHRQIVPKDFETRAVVDRGEFADAVKRVSLMAQHSAPLRVTVDVEEKKLTLSAQTQDVGDASEDVEIKEAVGQRVEIAFNHGFLTDGISVAAEEGTEEDLVALEVVSPLKPGVLKNPAEAGFTYIIMPVRLG